jgi:hypothetical protein
VCNEFAKADPQYALRNWSRDFRIRNCPRFHTINVMLPLRGQPFHVEKYPYPFNASSFHKSAVQNSQKNCPHHQDIPNPMKNHNVIDLKDTDDDTSKIIPSADTYSSDSPYGTAKPPALMSYDNACFAEIFNILPPTFDQSQPKGLAEAGFLLVSIGRGIEFQFSPSNLQSESQCF